MRNSLTGTHEGFAGNGNGSYSFSELLSLTSKNGLSYSADDNTAALSGTINNLTYSAKGTESYNGEKDSREDYFQSANLGDAVGVISGHLNPNLAVNQATAALATAEAAAEQAELAQSSADDDVEAKTTAKTATDTAVTAAETAQDEADATVMAATTAKTNADADVTAKATAKTNADMHGCISTFRGYYTFT